VKDELRSAAAASLSPSSGAEGSPAAETQTPTLHGHFAVFNRWTEIDSSFEGNFLERMAPGAFAHTLTHDRGRIKILFQHGRDAMTGSKPLGIPTVLREDDYGGYYEVPLLDTAYVAELVPGLRAGAYGASFRFQVSREDIVQAPERSSYNPRALPERTIRQARVLELGPVSFPAYLGATANIRSLSDWYRSTTQESLP
jgi:HK97 family phage prohead protease